jgi:hypothetical protein
MGIKARTLACVSNKQPATRPAQSRIELTYGMSGGRDQNAIFCLISAQYGVTPSGKTDSQTGLCLYSENATTFMAVATEQEGPMHRDGKT